MTWTTNYVVWIHAKGLRKGIVFAFVLDVILRDVEEFILAWP